MTMSFKDKRKKIVKKIDDFFENAGICPECKHNTPDGIKDCNCKDKHCACNPTLEQNWGRN
jgi:hypothetical protein